MHCAHLRVNGEKMSKSLGNFFTLRDLIEKGWSGREIRMVLINGHYRQPLNFTFDAMEAARTALARIDECVDALEECAGGAAPADSVLAWAAEARDAFTVAVNDDLNIRGVCALFGCARSTARCVTQLAQPTRRRLLTLRICWTGYWGDPVGRRATERYPPRSRRCRARAAARAAKEGGVDRLRDELRPRREVRDSKEGQKQRSCK